MFVLRVYANSIPNNATTKDRWEVVGFAAQSGRHYGGGHLWPQQRGEVVPAQHFAQLEVKR